MTMMYLEQENYENLIIDLRGNSGGDVILMAYILDMLVTEKDVVLYSIKERSGEVESLLSSGEGFGFEKIIVLVNERTASAAEIFTQSLREITGALVIGTQTFGKGVGQDYIELENGDIAAITAFEIISSEGLSYHAEGIAPDISISPARTTIERGRLEQLNFVNSVTIREGASNNAVLALNQRLARIGYISPDDATSDVTDKIITAVEIFQRFHNLPIGISRIDYRFIEILNHRVSLAPTSYEESDTVLERAKEYILNE
jgi:carboxyl-terminal processing protease